QLSNIGKYTTLLWQPLAPLTCVIFWRKMVYQKVVKSEILSEFPTGSQHLKYTQPHVLEDSSIRMAAAILIPIQQKTKCTETCVYPSAIIISNYWISFIIN